MTDVIDTGEIPRINPGEQTVRLVGETLTNLSYAGVIGLRRPDATGELPVVPVVPGPDAFLPPGQPRPPRPLPSPDGPPKPGLIVEWEVTPPTETLSLLDSLSPILPQPLLVKPVAYVGRHRDPSGRRASLLALFRQVYATLRGAL